MNISQDILKQRISSLVPPRNSRSRKASKEEDSNSSRKKKEQEKIITIDSSDSENNSNITIIHEEKKSEKPKRFSFSYPKTESKPLPKKKSQNSKVITIEDSSSEDDVKISSVTSTTVSSTSSNNNVTSNTSNSKIEEIVISDNDNGNNSNINTMNNNNNKNEVIIITNNDNDNGKSIKEKKKKEEEEEEEHVEENYIGFESSESEEEDKKEKEVEEEDHRKKRKRHYDVHSRDILTPISVPPWIQEGKKYSEFGPQMLHEEILDFVKYISPTPEEKFMREYALKKITDVIMNLWPDSVVKTYGSYKTNLYLPTSDVDIVILNEDLLIPSCFFDLQDAIEEADIASKIEVIDKARIPIIKLVEKETGYHFDISANTESGINSAKIMEKFIESTGYGQAIIALVLIIKQFLAQRYMNEVYTGGLGSYSVFILVTNFIMVNIYIYI
ncbi:hypothetical protein PIROE2DRAFT_57662 [Piromyces sp. E2]|nr:hypothetical protein PIROE2DRAFT_57662 [Piromyces sp. E2]|eukprot:OUM69020.1 hypothetical protein PIROE2DRAFT_57662 [Piromyces sp. E2]